jgi:TRAP-type C4-dicarboxylate transport system substrate-binding protein
VHNEFLDRANEHRGVHVLSLWASSPAHLFAVREPLARPEDLQGRRVVVVSGTAGRIAETYRAVTLNAATDRWYEMLSRGVADAVISTNTAITGWNLQNVLKAQLLFPEGLHYTSFFLVINRDRWNTLRPEDRAAIERLSGEAFAIRAGRMFDHHDRVAREAIASGGVRITEAPAEMIERMRGDFRGVEEEWLRTAAAAGVDGPAALARFREIVRSQPR